WSSGPVPSATPMLAVTPATPSTTIAGWAIASATRWPRACAAWTSGTSRQTSTNRSWFTRATTSRGRVSTRRRCVMASSTCVAARAPRLAYTWWRSSTSTDTIAIRPMSTSCAVSQTRSRSRSRTGMRAALGSPRSPRPAWPVAVMPGPSTPGSPGSDSTSSSSTTRSSAISTGSSSWLTIAAARRARRPARTAATVVSAATSNATPTTASRSGFSMRGVSSSPAPRLSSRDRRRPGARHDAPERDNRGVTTPATAAVRVVIFDFYGTLARNVAETPGVGDVLADHGYRLPDAAGEIWWDGDLGGVERRDRSRSRDHYVAWQHERLLELLAAADVHPGEYEAILTKLRRGDAERHLEAYPEVHDALATVRARGLRLAVCSNWDWDLEPAVAEAGLDGSFDLLVSSAWAGARKPHPRIYRHTLERLDVEPGAALFVGDTWGPDV